MVPTTTAVRAAEADRRRAGHPVVRWRVRLGSGYSGVAVSGGRAVTMFSDGGDDVLAAFDEASGEELWRVRIAERYKGINGSFDGPISTPTIADGRVFALAAAGQLSSPRTWRRGVSSGGSTCRRGKGTTRPELGFASSPVLAGGVVVVQVGGPGRAIVGFDPVDGRATLDGGAMDVVRISRRPWSGWGSATSWSRSVTRG